MGCLGECAEQVSYVPATDGVMLRETEVGQVAYRQRGPGILREVAGANRLGVRWVDEGFRTAAVGDADGRWAADPEDTLAEQNSQILNTAWALQILLLDRGVLPLHER